jgi:uncharacterized protein YkwD
MSVTFVRRALLPALLAAVFVLPASAHASSGTDATEASIVRAMNSVRAANHLPQLHFNRGLSRAADAQSRHVIRRSCTPTADSAAPPTHSRGT